MAQKANTTQGYSPKAINHSSGGSQRILAVAPRSRGFGFIVMENQTTPLDWGVCSCRGTKGVELAAFSRIRDLVEHYEPRSIVLEKIETNSRRGDRARLLLATIGNLGVWNRVRVHRISPTGVKKVFGAFRAYTKEEIAVAVSQQLPELAPDLPPHRKLWLPEHHRMAFFEAAAMALTFFYCKVRRTDLGKHPRPAKGSSIRAVGPTRIKKEVIAIP